MHSAGLRSDAAEAEILDFDVFIHSVPGAFAPEAGFFYAAKRRDFGGNDSAVDANDAVFESFGDAPDAGNIATVEVGSQTKFRIIGECDGVGFRFEPKKWRDWTERFFACYGHLRRDVSENRGLKEASAERVTMTAYKNFGAF